MTADYIADANCQGAWLFTEGSGTTVEDSSQNNNTGNFTSAGHPAWAVMAGTNAPLYAPFMADFAQGDTVSCGAFSAGGASTWSFVAWVRPDDWGSYNGVLGKTTATGFPDPLDFYLAQTTGKYNMSWGNGGATVKTGYGFRAANTLPTLGVWTHIAGTVNGGNASGAKIYANGAEQTLTISTDNFTGAFSTNSRTLFIGSRGGSGTVMDGKMTEVAIFNRVLSPTEINDIMDNGLHQDVPLATINQSFFGMWN